MLIASTFPLLNRSEVKESFVSSLMYVPSAQKTSSLRVTYLVSCKATVDCMWLNTNATTVAGPIVFSPSGNLYTSLVYEEKIPMKYSSSRMLAAFSSSNLKLLWTTGMIMTYEEGRNEKGSEEKQGRNKMQREEENKIADDDYRFIRFRYRVCANHRRFLASQWSGTYCGEPKPILCLVSLLFQRKHRMELQLYKCSSTSSLPACIRLTLSSLSGIVSDSCLYR